MKLDKDQLDKLETLFLDELLDTESKVPAAKLDILRKLLEKNNRLYVRPQPKDCGPALDQIRKELEDEVQGPVLPFPIRRAK